MEQAKTAPRLRKWHVVILAMLGTVALCVFGITGYFRLSSDTAALQTSLMKSVGGHWDKKIAVRVGWLTMGLVRNGLRCVHLAPEPRAVIEALHGVEVGVYNQAPGARGIDRGAMLSATDKAMSDCGWVRAVGVAKEHDFVAVYLPRKGISAGSMKCRVAVLHGETLVVVSARGNLEPLIQIARSHLDRRELNLAFR
jgi:hypothetical protein